ncbi:MAG: hypothetical protein WCA12_00595, partial [Burkholderiales bacterium]
RADHRPREAGSPAYTDALTAGAIPPMQPKFGDEIKGNATRPKTVLAGARGAAGPDNFAKNPPNATLSVYQPGGPQNTLTVVTISNPFVDGRDLVYSYKRIEGTMPKSGGVTALFVDWIGVGGGVGPGFHGVGVGARGIGWR